VGALAQDDRADDGLDEPYLAAEVAARGGLVGLRLCGDGFEGQRRETVAGQDAPGRDDHAAGGGVVPDVRLRRLWAFVRSVAGVAVVRRSQ